MLRVFLTLSLILVSTPAFFAYGQGGTGGPGGGVPGLDVVFTFKEMVPENNPTPPIPPAPAETDYSSKWDIKNNETFTVFAESYLKIERFSPGTGIWALQGVIREDDVLIAPDATKQTNPSGKIKLTPGSYRVRTRTKAWQWNGSATVGAPKLSNIKDHYFSVQ